MNDQKLKSQMTSGMIWKFAERFAAQGVSFVVSMVLARILMPEDYGAVAIINIFISIADVFLSSGLNTSLIQKRDADDLSLIHIFTKAGDVKLPDSEIYAYKLVIPNKEVREVFILQIQEWFKSVVANDNDTMKLLSKAIIDKDETKIAKQLNIVMGRMISILDTKAPDDMKENFYHGLLLDVYKRQ